MKCYQSRPFFLSLTHGLWWFNCAWMNLLNGQFVYIASLNIDLSWDLNKNAIIILQSLHGVWHFFLFLVDETRCGDPEQPLSSTVDRQSADKVVYSCVKGFKMEGGDAERHCLPNGLWSGHPPSCSGDQLFSIFYYSVGGSSNAGHFPMRAPAEFCIEREATPTSTKNQFVTLHLLCGRNGSRSGGK